MILLVKVRTGEHISHRIMSLNKCKCGDDVKIYVAFPWQPAFQRFMPGFTSNHVRIAAGKQASQTMSSQDLKAIIQQLVERKNVLRLKEIITLPNQSYLDTYGSWIHMDLVWFALFRKKNKAN